MFSIAAVVLAAVASAERPSFLFVLLDDLGFGEPGYTGGEHRAQTPFLDALAANGTVLEGHLSHSICAPSRAALMTGRKPHRLGVDGRHPNLSLDERTIADELHALGYRTSMVGKWHLGDATDVLTLPTRRGFESFLGILGSAADPHTFEDMIRELGEVRYALLRGEQVARTGDGSYLGGFSTDVYVDETLAILSEYDNETPFFHYFAAQMVHEPLHAPIADALEQVDAALERLMAGIDELGLGEHLITVVVSDNGGFSHFRGIGSNLPLNGGKRTLHEGGIRTPAIVSSPLLGSARGTRSSALVAIEDWLPTLVTLAGGTPSPDVDGFDIWPTIAEDAPSPRSVWASIQDLVLGINPVRILRTADFKYMENVVTSEGGNCSTPYPPDLRVEDPSALSIVDVCIFDLSQDPFEQAPLNSDTPLFERIRKLGEDAMDREEDLVPTALTAGATPSTPKAHPDWVNRRWGQPPAPAPGLPLPLVVSPVSSRSLAASDPLLAFGTSALVPGTWTPPCLDGIDVRNGSACTAPKLADWGPNATATPVELNLQVSDWKKNEPIAEARVHLRAVTPRGQSAFTLSTNATGWATLETEFQGGPAGVMLCRERIEGTEGGHWEPNELPVCFLFG